MKTKAPLGIFLLLIAMGGCASHYHATIVLNFGAPLATEEVDTVLRPPTISVAQRYAYAMESEAVWKEFVFPLFNGPDTRKRMIFSGFSVRMGTPVMDGEDVTFPFDVTFRHGGEPELDALCKGLSQWNKAALKRQSEAALRFLKESLTEAEAKVESLKASFRPDEGSPSERDAYQLKLAEASVRMLQRRIAAQLQSESVEKVEFVHEIRKP